MLIVIAIILVVHVGRGFLRESPKTPWLGWILDWLLFFWNLNICLLDIWDNLVVFRVKSRFSWLSQFGSIGQVYVNLNFSVDIILSFLFAHLKSCHLNVGILCCSVVRITLLRLLMVDLDFRLLNLRRIRLRIGLSARLFLRVVFAGEIEHKYTVLNNLKWFVLKVIRILKYGP